MKQFIFLLIAFTVYSASEAQTKLTLKPNATDGKDAMIWTAPNLKYDNLNYGDDNRLLCHSWTNQGEQDKSRMLIEFDLSDIPSGVLINKATLTIFNNPNPYSGSFNGQHKEQSGTNESILNRIIQNWSEDSVTWNNQPSITTQGQITNSRLTNPHGDLIIDVTAMMNDMLKDTVQCGFMLTLKNESPYKALVFASSDDADSTKWPQLEIEYSTISVKEFKPRIGGTLSITPNPSVDKTRIMVNLDKPETWGFKVFDPLGKLVFEKNLIYENGFQFDHSMLANGTYNLYIYTESGIVLTSKMLKLL